MSEWKKCMKSAVMEARPYVEGEDLSGVSVSERDVPEKGGYIMRNPTKLSDKWYVNKEFFAANYLFVAPPGEVDA